MATTHLPTTMKALVTLGDGGFELKEVKTPSPAANQVLVKVVAAAQNPTDCETIQQPDDDRSLG